MQAEAAAATQAEGVAAARAVAAAAAQQEAVSAANLETAAAGAGEPTLVGLCLREHRVRSEQCCRGKLLLSVCWAEIAARLNSCGGGGGRGPGGPVAGGRRGGYPGAPACVLPSMPVRIVHLPLAQANARAAAEARAVAEVDAARQQAEANAARQQAETGAARQQAEAYARAAEEVHALQERAGNNPKLHAGRPQIEIQTAAAGA